MKWLYLIAGIAFYLKMLLIPNPSAALALPYSIIDAIAQDSGIPNVVSGIILRNRLYDTIFEVVVFTIAIMGCNYLLANEQPLGHIYQFPDQSSILLARFGATISTLVAIELAIRGHLSPGGGFSAGVAGGTAIGLVAMTSSLEWIQSIYQRWRASVWEKVSVLIFVLLSVITLSGVELSHGEMGELMSGGIIPILNILVAIKVALGSWTVVLIFIRYRGLL
ncbi:MAG: Na(+)/H(+) antiporter subunit B [Synechococcales bacterium]|nr:Na(+)/H(+) antiporter subunit B [Synechococcales bacterium]